MKGGNKIVFPTIFPELDKHFPDIPFIDKDMVDIDYECRDTIIKNNTTIVPFRFADQILRVSYRNCMASKYRMFDLPVDMWRELRWERDLDNENKLFYKVLGLKDKDKYNLINTNFMSDFSGHARIKIHNDYKNITMEHIPDFSMLDWGMVIERAKSIYTVATSLMYIIEIIDTSKMEELHLYKREGMENHHEYYDYLLTKKWVLH
jgi:hypothetical protein